MRWCGIIVTWGGTMSELQAAIVRDVETFSTSHVEFRAGGCCLVM